ncbi:MAG: hypothetical protein KDJ69_12005 [Nitratireductor sp.]|nr:hypothetical protein [Nitratireductor sp.]
MSDKSVMLLASTGDEANRISAFCKRAFGQVETYHGNWGQPLPGECNWWQGDLLISYCSRWIVPQSLLERAAVAAINFHPAPPEYPGVGGINWALYDGASSFGVTCHHMTPEIDAGSIVEVRRFPIIASEDVESLFQRTHTHLETLAYDVIARLANDLPLPTASESWGKVRRTRDELNELATITPDMTGDEITRRIRATSFGSWKPTVKVGSFEFELKS